jgi:hypothetical protein
LLDVGLAKWREPPVGTGGGATGDSGHLSQGDTRVPLSNGLDSVLVINGEEGNDALV